LVLIAQLATGERDTERLGEREKRNQGEKRTHRKRESGREGGKESVRTRACTHCEKERKKA